MKKIKITTQDLANYVKETGWTPPPLPDRFLRAYLDGTMEDEEREAMGRKIARDPVLARRLAIMAAKS